MTNESSTQAFCARCGAEHAGHRRSAWGRALLAFALLSLLAVSGASLWMSLSTRAELDGMNVGITKTNEDVAAVQQELAAAQEEQAMALRSLAILEAEVREVPDPSQTARRAARSVFTVRMGPATGSGFAVRKKGGRTLIVTNYHVIADGFVRGLREVEVTRDDLTYAGTVTDVSEDDDLAVIAVEKKLPTISLLQQRPRIGEPVLVLGSPHGLGGTVTSGIVSAFRSSEGLDYLQFSAPISPGSSGGPVLDANGRVLGVTVGKNVSDNAEGLAFAIPADRVCAAVNVC